MDAFAVAVCKGMEMQRFTYKGALIIASFFGGLQGIMPLIGYFIGSGVSQYIEKIGYPIAFAILIYLGIKMIIESREPNKNIKRPQYSLNIKEILFLGIATSIDALAVGFTFPILKISIFVPALVIALITGVMAIVGVFLGSKFGEKYNKLAKIIGGVMLIFIGCKILFEHF